MWPQDADALVVAQEDLNASIASAEATREAGRTAVATAKADITQKDVDGHFTVDVLASGEWSKIPSACPSSCVVVRSRH